MKHVISTTAKVVALAWTLLGCPGPTFIVQQYAGPVRPRETIAILRSNATDDAKLLFLDEQDIAAPIAEDGRLHIEMLPARHTVMVGRASAPNERYSAIAFVAEADHVYRVAFEGGDPHVFEVDRGKDTLLRDVTVARPPPPPSPPPPPPAPVTPATPPPSDADAGTPGE